MQFVPVDHDPFAQSEAGAQPRLVPVDHDPFAGDKGSLLDRAISPITSMPETYGKMRQESQAQMGRGVDQIRSGVNFATTPTPDGVSKAAGLPDLLKGVGNVAAGGIGYLASPINAAVRSLAGKPVQDATGIPAEYTDFAVTLALPGVGMTRAPSIARAPKQTPPTVDELKSAASAGYKSDEIAKLEVKPAAQEAAMQKIIGDMNAAGFTKETAGKTMSVLETAAKAPDGAVAVTGQNIGSLNKTLNKIRMSPDAAEREAARVAKQHVDNYFAGLTPDDILKGDAAAAREAYKEANANWSAAAKADNLDSKVYRAEMRASAANSGMNTGNTIKQRLVDVLADKRQRMGMSKAQIEMAERIVNGTAPKNAIRFFGNMLGGGGGLGSVAAAGAGALATGGWGAVAPIVGHGLRRLENAMVGRDVDKLSALIRSDSPLAKRVKAPLTDWSKAAILAERSPKPANIAKLTLASNNLANNLKDAGIRISPEDILRSLQGGAPGRADEEQP